MCDGALKRYEIGDPWKMHDADAYIQQETFSMDHSALCKHSGQAYRCTTTGQLHENTSYRCKSSVLHWHLLWSTIEDANTESKIYCGISCFAQGSLNAADASQLLGQPLCCASLCATCYAAAFGIAMLLRTTQPLPSSARHGAKGAEAEAAAAVGRLHVLGVRRPRAVATLAPFGSRQTVRHSQHSSWNCSLHQEQHVHMRASKTVA